MPRKSTPRTPLSATPEVSNSLRAAGSAATLPAATDREPHRPGAAPDLLSVIEAYRQSNEAFNRHKLTADDEIQQYAAETYGPWFDALRGWSRNATGPREAVAALHLAVEEMDGGCSAVVDNMIKAALPFFDQIGQSSIISQRETWELQDAASEINSTLSVILCVLELLSDGLVGNPLIHHVADLQNVVRLMKFRSEAASDHLDEISHRFIMQGAD